MKNSLKKLVKKIKIAIVNRVLRIRVRRRLKKMQKLNQREATVARIVKAALADRRNILMVAPLSGTKYIKMPDEGMFIIIGGSNVIISNHKFYYDIDVSMELSDYLIDRFNRILERQRNSMEKEMLSNVQTGLTDIANTIEKKINENGSKIRENIREELKTFDVAPEQNL